MTTKRLYECSTQHFGPVCANGGPNGEATCEWCGGLVSRADRERIQRQWNVVHGMLAKHKPKEKKT